MNGIEIIVDKQTYFITNEAIRAFEPQNINVQFRGTPRNFTGVSVIAVFESLGVSLEGVTRGVVTGDATGYTQPFTVGELMDSTQFHFAFAEEGTPLDSIMSVFAHDDRPTRSVRGVSAIRLLGGEEDKATCGLLDNEFVIIRGASSQRVTMDELIAIGFEDFVTNIPTGDGTIRHFAGVRLTNILARHKISIKGATTLTTTSHGATFSAVWNVDPDLEHIFIATAENGEVLSPHSGPFFGIAQHKGSNFNPRNLQSITIN